MSDRLEGAAIDTVLFDVGNTLHHLDYGFIAGVLRAHGCACTAGDLAVAEYAAKAAVDASFRARRAGTDATRHAPYFEVICDEIGVAARAREEILEALRRENAARLLWRVMHPETPHVIAALRARGFTLGVVSNADGRVRAALEADGLAVHFSAILDSSVVGVEKPDPRIFQMALERCNAVPERALFVGDIYEIDVRGARAAGLTAILLDPLGRYGDVDCPRISALAELLEVLPATAME